MEFLQIFRPLPMIIQIGVHFDTKLHVHKTEHPPLSSPPPKKKPQQKNKSSGLHIFSHIYLLKV